LNKAALEDPETFYKSFPKLRQVPPLSCEVAVIPGARLARNGEISDLGKQRVKLNVEFLRSGWVKRLFFAGGPPTRDLPKREADIMEN
jgi:hypothetical protein